MRASATRLLLATFILTLSGCAMVSDMSRNVFATKVNAIAIIDNQLIKGDLALGFDRSGTLTLNEEKGELQSCVGPLRYTSTAGGVIAVHCNGGVELELQFKLLGETRGYAYGQTAKGPASLTFGLSNLEAKAYLRVPVSKKLVENADEDTLELR